MRSAKRSQSTVAILLRPEKLPETRQVQSPSSPPLQASFRAYADQDLRLIPSHRNPNCSASNGSRSNWNLRKIMPNGCIKAIPVYRSTVHSPSKEFPNAFPTSVVGKSHDLYANSYGWNVDCLPSKLPSICCPKGSKQRFWCHPCLFKYLKFRETGHSYSKRARRAAPYTMPGYLSSNGTLYSITPEVPAFSRPRVVFQAFTRSSLMWPTVPGSAPRAN